MLAVVVVVVEEVVAVVVVVVVVVVVMNFTYKTKWKHELKGDIETMQPRRYRWG